MGCQGLHGHQTPRPGAGLGRVQGDKTGALGASGSSGGWSLLLKVREELSGGGHGAFVQSASIV